VSRGSTAFILATSSDILAHFSQLTAGLGIDGYPAYRRPDGDGDFLSNAEVTVIEGKAVAPLRDNDGKALFEKLFGKKPFAIAKKLTDYALPVVARNCLGENKNLWYEELVPHQSLFYFVVLVPEGEPALDFPKPVQFGGNASVGYGYTKVTKLWEGEQG
jgi:CRISPR-associated protein Cmr4